MTLICLTIICLKISKSDYKTNMYRPMSRVSTVLNGTTFYMSFKKIGFTTTNGLVIKTLGNCISEKSDTYWHYFIRCF